MRPLILAAVLAACAGSSSPRSTLPPPDATLTEDQLVLSVVLFHEELARAADAARGKTCDAVARALSDHFRRHGHVLDRIQTEDEARINDLVRARYGTRADDALTQLGYVLRECDIAQQVYRRLGAQVSARREARRKAREAAR